MSFFMHQVVDPDYGNYYQFTTLGYGTIVLIMFLLLFIACFFHGNFSSEKVPKKFSKFSTKQLVFAALSMALAFVTSNIKLIDMPMGGAVTLCSMFFISFSGYLFGLRKGILIAIAYGFLQLFTNPWVISIPQLFMDYIFAFGALGLCGIFSQKKHGLLLGFLLSLTGRFICSFLSGYLFFSDYAQYYDMGAITYSFVYNISYIGLEGLLTIIILALPPVKKGLAQVQRLANQT